jgi:DNA repair exonuclease SbcCD ATPase subunit
MDKPNFDASKVAESVYGLDPSALVNVHDLTDALQRLRTVAAQIESFLTGQIQRIADAMRVYKQVRAEAEAVRERFAELESERQRWNSIRDAEAQRLQQASESLIHAWEQLDARQRQLLIEQRRAEAKRSDVATPVVSSRPATAFASAFDVRPLAEVELTLTEIQALKRDLQSQRAARA